MDRGAGRRQFMGLQGTSHDWVTNTNGPVQFSWAGVSNSLLPQGLQHARLPCPSPIPRACSNSCPSSWWCHPAIQHSHLTLLSTNSEITYLGSKYPNSKANFTFHRNIPTTRKNINSSVGLLCFSVRAAKASTWVYGILLIGGYIDTISNCLSLVLVCCCLVAQSLHDPTDCSTPTPIPSLLCLWNVPAWILEWVAISFSRGSSQLRDLIHVSCIGRWILYCWATWEALKGFYIL